MTLKYEKLVEFKKHLNSIGYIEEISATILDFEIGKFFGVSVYTIINVKKALERMGLMHTENFNTWKMRQ